MKCHFSLLPKSHFWDIKASKAERESDRGVKWRNRELVSRIILYDIVWVTIWEIPTDRPTLGYIEKTNEKLGRRSSRIHRNRRGWFFLLQSSNLPTFSSSCVFLILSLLLYAVLPCSLAPFPHCLPHFAKSLTLSSFPHFPVVLLPKNSVFPLLTHHRHTSPTYILDVSLHSSPACSSSRVVRVVLYGLLRDGR